MGKTKLILTGLLTIGLLFGFVCFEAWIATFLINWVIGLFGCDFALTFWQCVGICALLSFVVNFLKKIIKKNKKTLDKLFKA